MNTNLIKAIIPAGLVAGTFDAIAASVSYMISSGSGNPMPVWTFVASGVFGIEAARAGGLTYQLLGLLFHYFIAMCWTALFFVIYPLLQKIRMPWPVLGILYGIFVGTFMSRVIIPLSNTPQADFSWYGFIKGVLIIVFAIGIPVVFMAKRYYNKHNTSAFV